MKKTDQIRALIKEEKSLKEIYEALPEMKKELIRGVLNGCVKKGTVTRTKKGCYVLTAKKD